jgi:DNA-binding transcriptional LysR family regulator
LPPTGRLTVTELFTEPLVAVLPSSHELAVGPTVLLDQLAVLPFIDFPPGYGLRHETDRGFASVPRRVAFEVTRVDEVIQFVSQDLGVALLPESVADLYRQVNLVAPGSTLRSAASQAFIGCVEDHIGRHVDATSP